MRIAAELITIGNLFCKLDQTFTWKEYNFAFLKWEYFWRQDFSSFNRNSIECHRNVLHALNQILRPKSPVLSTLIGERRYYCENSSTYCTARVSSVIRSYHIIQITFFKQYLPQSFSFYCWKVFSSAWWSTPWKYIGARGTCSFTK